MRSTLLSLAASAALGAALLLPAPAGHAGDISNAQLGCYVDTYAYDYPEIDTCYGMWTP